MRIIRALGLVVALLAIACSAGPRPIAYGRADCTYCRMRIDDPRYGGEIVSTHGKVLQFDAVECMASYYRAMPDRGTAASLWVADFEHPGTLLAAREARFAKLSGAPRTGTPMGGGVFAVRSDADAQKLRDQLGDVTLLTWEQVVASASDTHGSESHAE